MNKSSGNNDKPDTGYGPHLVLNDLVLPPGGEWSPKLEGWTALLFSAGSGYWEHEHTYNELHAGGVLILSAPAQGSFRASQIGGLKLHYFRIEPRRLVGLLTMTEESLLKSAEHDARHSARMIPPRDPLAERFKTIVKVTTGHSLPERLQLLQLFIDTFAGEFKQPDKTNGSTLNAKDRLKQLLNDIPAAEFFEMSFAELSRKTLCTPRHMGRLFSEVAGKSFREKQTEHRLARACELLATTETKVVEVALESGYQSTSLFNLMFKRRFGVSPGKWRENARTKTTKRKQKTES